MNAYQAKWLFVGFSGVLVLQCFSFICVGIHGHYRLCCALNVLAVLSEPILAVNTDHASHTGMFSILHPFHTHIIIRIIYIHQYNIIYIIYIYHSNEYFTHYTSSIWIGLQRQESASTPHYRGLYRPVTPSPRGFEWRLRCNLLF